MNIFMHSLGNRLSSFVISLNPIKGSNCSTICMHGLGHSNYLFCMVYKRTYAVDNFPFLSIFTAIAVAFFATPCLWHGTSCHLCSMTMSVYLLSTSEIFTLYHDWNCIIYDTHKNMYACMAVDCMCVCVCVRVRVCACMCVHACVNLYPFSSSFKVTIPDIDSTDIISHVMLQADIKGIDM